MLVQSALTNDQDNVVCNLEAGVVMDVGGDGVIWGTGKYEQLDPGWAEAFAVFLESLIAGRHPFMANPAIVPIPTSSRSGWRAIGAPATGGPPQIRRRAPTWQATWFSSSWT